MNKHTESFTRLNRLNSIQFIWGESSRSRTHGEHMRLISYSYAYLETDWKGVSGQVVKTDRLTDSQLVRAGVKETKWKVGRRRRRLRRLASSGTLARLIYNTKVSVNSMETTYTKVDTNETDRWRIREQISEEGKLWAEQTCLLS